MPRPPGMFWGIRDPASGSTVTQELISLVPPWVGEGWNQIDTEPFKARYGSRAVTV